MTPQERKVFELALRACENIVNSLATHDDEGMIEHAQQMIDAREAIAAIKQVLAQPEQIPPSAYSNTHQPEQEPVVGTKTWFEDGKVVTQYLYPSDIYTAPPQPEPCDMKDMCIGCSPRNADGSCPDAQPEYQSTADKSKLEKVPAKGTLLAQPEPPPECPMDSYGDGNVYRGQRSKDSVVKTITLAQQEPVAWLSKGGKGIWFHEPDASLNATPLYTTPPQRKPLTDKQLNIIGSRWHLNLLGADEKAELFAFARAIEAAHGIKE